MRLTPEQYKGWRFAGAYIFEPVGNLWKLYYIKSVEPNGDIVVEEC